MATPEDLNIPTGIYVTSHPLTPALIDLKRIIAQPESSFSTDRPMHTQILAIAGSTTSDLEPAIIEAHIALVEEMEKYTKVLEEEVVKLTRFTQTFFRIPQHRSQGGFKGDICTKVLQRYTFEKLRKEMAGPEDESATWIDGNCLPHHGLPGSVKL